LFDRIYEFLVNEKDLLGSLAALATIFALVVPLPFFVISTILQRISDAKERSHRLVEKVVSAEYRLLREQTLAIVLSTKFANPEAMGDLIEAEKNTLQAFMNSQEIIGLHLNSSRIRDRTFFKFWGSAYANDWERMKPYVETLRRDWGSRLYVEWEAAVQKYGNL
jgi:hypothetical protein